jgi:hypothetical protein
MRDQNFHAQKRLLMQTMKEHWRLELDQLALMGEE